MQKSQKSVKEFMAMFGQSTPEAPGIPPEDVLKMRCSTLAEEAAEFAMAAGYALDVHASPDMKAPNIKLLRDPGATPDIVGMIDALIDSQYFIDGSGIALGVDLEPFFDAVHAANMSKLWKASDLTLMEPVHVCQRVAGTEYFIVRREDGKVIKPPGFKPADLSQVLKVQTPAD